MASIQVRKETGLLIIDLYVNGQRCREQTSLEDTPANRKKLEKVLARIEADQKAGTFDYAKYFPNSRMVMKLAVQEAVGPVAGLIAGTVTGSDTASSIDVEPVVSALRPDFKDFAVTWVAENEVTWRRSNRRTVDDILNVLTAVSN